MSSLTSRRRFLQQASALALTPVPWLSRWLTPHPETHSTVPPEAWAALGKHLRGPVLRPGDFGFARLSSPWNLRYKDQPKPQGIARCLDAEDVRTCLQWVQAHKMPFMARSGGHSYAAYSMTPGLTIDLSLQNSLRFDDRTGRATVGGGATNATLYNGLPKTGRSVTHGRCKPVGVGGLVLGGGIGFNMRRHGLLIDQLKETEIVLASGRKLRCNAQENADLFWACQGGGGGNFGINTSFTFQTFPVGELTVFDLNWTEKLDELLPVALDLLPGMPDRLGCKLSVVNRAGQPLRMNLLGQLAGSVEEFKKLMAPLFRLARPSGKPATMSYWAAQDVLTEAGTPEYSHERSHYGFGTMSQDGCRAILKNMRAWPGTQALTTWKMFLVGGAIARVPAHHTAYWHRNASMCTSVELNWEAGDRHEVIERNEQWLTHFHAEMAQYTSEQSYQNFIDASQHDYLRAYYGGNLDKLMRVKYEVDPHNVFHFPQSIPPRKG
jgi:FAD/FMN-containing dehydrogenase